MISTISTYRGIAPGTSCDAAGGRVRSAAPVVTTAMKSVGHRITAQVPASSFVEGQVWLRPATLDVLVPTTPGHLAWSPPT